MGLIQTDWVATTVNGHTVLKCTLTQESSAAQDSFTYKTPKELDPNKSWILVVNTAGTTIESTTLPVDMWAGYDENATLADDSGTDVSATSTSEIAAAIMDNVEAEKLASVIDPHYIGTRIQAITDVGGHINLSKAPYYIINLDGTSALTEAACLIVITQ